MGEFNSGNTIEDFSQLSQWEKNQISIDDMEEMDGDRVSDVKGTE